MQRDPLVARRSRSTTMNWNTDRGEDGRYALVRMNNKGKDQEFKLTDVHGHLSLIPCSSVFFGMTRALFSPLVRADGFRPTGGNEMIDPAEPRRSTID